MEKRKPNDLPPEQCLAVDTDTLCKLLCCGRHTAVQIGDLANARITMNTRVLWSVQRIKGAVFCALDEGKSKRGHLYISSEELEKSALKLLNEKIPVPELRLHQQEVRDMMQEMILNGAIVSVKDNIYLPRVFAQEDETARRIAQRLVTQMPVEHIAPVLEQVKVEMGLRLSAQQEAAVYAAFRHGLSVITGSPGTGKTTVLRTILEVFRLLRWEADLGRLPVRFWHLPSCAQRISRQATYPPWKTHPQ